MNPKFDSLRVTVLEEKNNSSSLVVMAGACQPTETSAGELVLSAWTFGLVCVGKLFCSFGVSVLSVLPKVQDP